MPTLVFLTLAAMLPWLESRTWTVALASCLCCVILGKSLHLSEPHL